MIGDIIFIIPISFSIFLIIWYGIIQRKLYNKIQDNLNEYGKTIKKGLETMKKTILERKPEPPKDRKEFWEIFVKSCDNTYENQKEIEGKQSQLKIDFEKVKIYNLIPIVIAIVVVIFTALNYGLYLQEVNLHQIEVNELLDEKISHVVADERISRNLYELKFHNEGEVENGLQIEIWFYNHTIDNAQLPSGISQLVYNETSHSNTYFAALYSHINEKQNLSVYIHLINDSEEKIKPFYVRAWTNKGQVKINQDNG